MNLRHLCATLALALLIAAPVPVLSQRTPLYQDGVALPNHLGKFTTQGRSTDVGTMDGDALGAGASPFAIDDRGGSALRARDGYSTDPLHPFNLNVDPYHVFEVGHDSDGNARLLLDSRNGAPLRTLVCDFNGVRSLCLGSAVSGMPSVDSTAALALLPSTYAPAVVRLDTVAGAGAPPQLYRATGSPCALGGGTGDGGLQVASADGFCWVALLPAAGADIRMWSQIGTADDTATGALADTAMRSESWPSGVAKVLHLPRGTVRLKNLNLLCASLIGVGEGGSIVATTDDATATDVMINYTGPADGVECPPLEVAGITFAMPPVDQITLVVPPIQKAIRIEKDDGVRAPIFGVRLHDNTFTGGNIGVLASGVIGAHLWNLTGDRQWNTSFIVNGYGAATGTNITAPTGNNIVENIVCKGGGNYCVSATANAHAVPALAIQDTIVRNVYCIGMGWISAKMCVDGVTGGENGANYTGIVSRDSRAGGLEIKTGEFTMVTSPGMRNANVDVTCYNSLDFGSCFWMPFDGPSVTPDLIGQMSGRVYATWTPPAPYVAGAYYDTGKVVTNGGNTYLAVTPGLTAGVAPTHTGIVLTSASVIDGGTGCPDGVAVQFQLAPGPVGVILKEVVVSGNVGGGVLSDPLTIVAGTYRTTSPDPQDSVPIGSSCTTRPKIAITTTGIATANDGEAQWLYIEPTPVRANSFSAVTDEAVTDTELTVVAQNTAYGIFVRPTGSSDRTSRRHRYHLTADVYNACVMDGPGLLSSSPVGTVDQFVLVSPWCRAQNFSSSAAIWVGHSDATYTNNWPNFIIDGGEIIAERSYAIKDRYFSGISVTPGTVGLTLNGTLLVGAVGTVYDEGSPWTIKHIGGSISTTDAANAVNPIRTGTNASAVLNYTATPGTVVTNGRPTAYQDWVDGAGSTFNFGGRLYDGTAAVAPTSRCNYGQVVQSLTPGAGGQPVNGWYCSTPAFTWTAF